MESVYMVPSSKSDICKIQQLSPASEMQNHMQNPFSKLLYDPQIMPH